MESTKRMREEQGSVNQLLLKKMVQLEEAEQRQQRVNKEMQKLFNIVELQARLHCSVYDSDWQVLNNLDLKAVVQGPLDQIGNPAKKVLLDAKGQPVSENLVAAFNAAVAKQRQKTVKILKVEEADEELHLSQHQLSEKLHQLTHLMMHSISALEHQALPKKLPRTRPSSPQKLLEFGKINVNDMDSLERSVLLEKQPPIIGPVKNHFRNINYSFSQSTKAEVNKKLQQNIFSTKKHPNNLSKHRRLISESKDA